MSSTHNWKQEAAASAAVGNRRCCGRGCDRLAVWNCTTHKVFACDTEHKRLHEMGGNGGNGGNGRPPRAPVPRQSSSGSRRPSSLYRISPPMPRPPVPVRSPSPVPVPVRFVLAVGCVESTLRRVRSRPNMAVLCFDRSPTAKPDSAIFVASTVGVLRFDIATGGLSTLVQIETFGVVCTSAGFLILSKNHSLSAIHIATGAVEPIDSAVVNRLKWPRDLALSDTDRTLYVALNASFQITAVSLPDAYFTADSTQ